eukprot:1019051-Pelagomonas_calceolata.AAC.6
MHLDQATPFQTQKAKRQARRRSGSATFAFLTASLHAVSRQRCTLCELRQIYHLRSTSPEGQGDRGTQKKDEEREGKARKQNKI